MRALFAVSSLGLGHATRSLVLIQAFLQRGYQITIISTGNALAFLKLELADHPGVDWRDMTDYPPLERGTGWRFYAYLLIDLLKTWRRIRAEHRAFDAWAAEYDFVFSDGRYGFYSRWTPSFVLSHQIAFIPPKGLHEIGWLSDHLNAVALKKFDRIFIPDYPGPSRNLAGNLSHTPVLNQAAHHYIGILSAYPHLTCTQDIDYLFVISGYLQEHKGAFVQNLLAQAEGIPGKKVFILGDPEVDMRQFEGIQNDDLTIYPLATGDLRVDLFSRARCVISRAGYTTVMDLVEHDKQALLIPTPNQTEQEYLAYYLDSLHYFATRDQSAPFDLSAALSECQSRQTFVPPWRTDGSVQRILDAMSGLIYKHYFTVIVPAHNEETELARTLDALLAQRYPASRMEIIVVENGSSDATLSIARGYESRVDTRFPIRVIQSERGVSRAKNAGLSLASLESEWVVFCDADTYLGPEALHQFNTWVNRHGAEGLSVGTTQVRPQPAHRLYARFWFGIYDVIHRVTRSSYAIQLARTPIARGVGFHAELNFAEDLVFTRECRRYGRFFFLPTNQVATSTRRFEARGYFRQSLRWLVEALMPMRMKRRRGYDVIR